LDCTSATNLPFDNEPKVFPEFLRRTALDFKLQWLLEEAWTLNGLQNDLDHFRFAVRSDTQILLPVAIGGEHPSVKKDQSLKIIKSVAKCSARRSATVGGCRTEN